LERRIEEAQTIPVACTPGTLVTMNSTVVLVDVKSGERSTCTLVYPEDRDLIPHSVGVLQQSGQCILGRSVGDIVQMTEGAKTRRFRIESIEYQPEAAGAAHL
jgi:regulator of nucleoside diphosphate kinase